MRTVQLLTLLLTAAAAGGCRGAPEGARHQAPRVPARDLTLEQPALPEVAVASPAELTQTRVERSAARHLRRADRPAPKRSRTPARREAPRAPTPVVAAPAPAASTRPEPADPHALAPGQTVTIIPASSGPSSAPATPREWPADEGPGTIIHAGGGGRCAPRGGAHPGTGWGGGFRGLR
jgi:hypothetical protein